MQSRLAESAIKKRLEIEKSRKRFQMNLFRTVSKQPLLLSFHCSFIRIFHCVIDAFRALVLFYAGSLASSLRVFVKMRRVVSFHVSVLIDCRQQSSDVLFQTVAMTSIVAFLPLRYRISLSFIPALSRRAFSKTCSLS